MQKPLQGIRVLDLSRILAGPWATQLLGDFGATVIKVERPGAGDDTRQWGPPYLEKDGHSASAYFLCANRAKQSITVEFTKPAGQKILRDLARQCDVVVENFKVGGLAAYGLDYAALSAINPGLIYCSITGYGQDGPCASWPGYDFVVQGAGGLMSVTGSASDEPMKVGVAVADVLTGLYASNAILAALRHRDATGKGQAIDLALLDVQLAALANQALNFLVSGNSPGRMGNVHPNIAPYQSFACRQGTINIAVGNDAQFRTLCAVVGAPGLAADTRFSTNALRVENRAALSALLQAEFSRLDGESTVTVLNQAGVPAGLVNTVEAAFGSDQAKARQMRRGISHPQLGEIPTVACPVRFSDTPVQYDAPPPSLGEHTAEVLRDLAGLSEDAIAALRRDGVI